MSEDANLAYNGNRYKSTLLRPRDSEISYSSISQSSSVATRLPTTATVSDSSPRRVSLGKPDSGTVFLQGIPSASNSQIGVEGTAIDQILGEFQARIHSFLCDHVAVVRFASHLSVMAVAGVILVFSSIELPRWNLALSTISNNIASATIDRALPTATNLPQNAEAIALGQGALAGVLDIALPRQILPFQKIAPEPVAVDVAARPAEIRVYTVQPGDTIFGIAKQLGLNPESLQWTNPALETNPDILRIGDQLKIPPADGVLHIVRSGDTLGAIASKYSVSVDAIVGFAGNNMVDSSSPLILNQELFVPGGSKPFNTPAPIAPSTRSASAAPWNATKGSGNFGWPASGQITQKYWRGHRAIDIASWAGNPVKSSDAGYVIFVGTGWSSGYGNHVIIDHGNGYQTLYAHLSSVWVSQGENVSKGEQIGAVGNTGNSTGPHLHFEVLYGGVGQDPLGYIR